MSELRPKKADFPLDVEEFVSAVSNVGKGSMTGSSRLEDLTEELSRAVDEAEGARVEAVDRILRLLFLSVDTVNDDGSIMHPVLAATDDVGWTALETLVGLSSVDGRTYAVVPTICRVLGSALRRQRPSDPAARSTAWVLHERLGGSHTLAELEESDLSAMFVSAPIRTAQVLGSCVDIELRRITDAFVGVVERLPRAVDGTLVVASFKYLWDKVGRRMDPVLAGTYWSRIVRAADARGFGAEVRSAGEEFMPGFAQVPPPQADVDSNVVFMLDAMKWKAR